MNNISIKGRITKKPTLRTVTVGGSQVPVCSFTVAVDDGFRKDAAGNKIGVEFFRVTAWRGMAEHIAAYGDKGRVVDIMGPVHLRKYADRNNGGLIWYMEITNIRDFEWGDNPHRNEAAATEEPVDVTDILAEVDDGGLPFVLD